ncbi:uncharacterized protein [Ranitomeya imitator]|uniref:uncharacterized protein n=1 Tax=Ranitomeya imitator TaxID=111125 RepID=UPI0037E71F85
MVKRQRKEESEEEDDDDDEEKEEEKSELLEEEKPAAKKKESEEKDDKDDDNDNDDEAIDMSQRLTREERIEIVLMSGERSTWVIAADFNASHSTRPPISHATVSKLLAKFRETGCV